MMEYADFLQGKKSISEPCGFEVAENQINQQLFDFQRAIAQWALRKGRAAIFADCGLGKTLMQLEWARLVAEKTGGDILLVAPLAVGSQTINEADEKLDGLAVTHCRTQADCKPGLNITNYEMLHKFDPARFVGMVADESGILKSYSGKIKQQIVKMFCNTQYRLACTATPSPNDHMEILNHGEFLGVMESHKALAVWFINDTQNMGRYRLKGHARKDFWRWVATWAISVSDPAELGYKTEGFALPPLNEAEIILPVDICDSQDGELFRFPALNATAFHKEKRLTCDARAAEVAEMVNSTDEIYCIWCDTNYEADALKAALPGAVEVRGSDKAERKERVAIEFATGKIRVLISKPKIFGFGMNFQICHNVIFCGLSYSYESYYQALRRFWRYGQANAVNCTIILGETERRILEVVKEKESKYRELKSSMQEAMSEAQDISNERKYRMEYARQEETGTDWKMILGDSVEEIKGVESDSVGFTVFSPPFSNLYIYSDSFRDMGNSESDDEFFEGFRYLLPELLRVTIPGRLCGVHCKQLVNYRGRDGSSGLRDFRGDLIREMIEAGWVYHSEICIWKSPVTEMYRTKAHGLLYKQLRKDSSFSRQGLPDYLLIFRKWGEEGEETDPVNWKTKENFELPKWQSYASPVWFDIDQMNVLNIGLARQSQDEKHICPLQLDVIKRAIEMWSNPGDLILSPFAGIGSEGYVALQNDRRFVGIELKESYYREALKNMERAKEHAGQQELFCAQN